MGFLTGALLRVTRWRECHVTGPQPWSESNPGVSRLTAFAARGWPLRSSFAVVTGAENQVVGELHPELGEKCVMRPLKNLPRKPWHLQFSTDGLQSQRPDAGGTNGVALAIGYDKRIRICVVVTAS